MNHELKTKAEELEALLGRLDESYTIAAQPSVDPDQPPHQESDERYQHLPELVKSIVDYAINKSPSTAGPREIGEAINVGIHEASNLLKLDNDKVMEAVEDFLDELRDTVRLKLSGE